MFVNRATYTLITIVVTLVLVTSQVVAIPNVASEHQRKTLEASNYIKHAMTPPKPLYAVALPCYVWQL
jgi:hypothetical protein